MIDEYCRCSRIRLMLHFGMSHDSKCMEAKSLYLMVALDNGAHENTQTFYSQQ